MTDWYAASLLEVQSFLDQFETKDRVYVRIDSDIVAALIGVLSGAPVIYRAAQHAHNAVTELALLES